MQPPERDFIQGFHDDETALKEIFEAFYAYLLAFALKYVDETSDGQDIVMNVFTTVWQKRLHIIHKDHIFPYLVKCVKNGCLKHIENQKIIRERRKDPALVESFQPATAEHQKWISDVISIIMELINSLPEDEKNVFVLSYIDECPNQEIAQKLGINMNMVYLRKSRALHRLRELVIKSNLSLDLKYWVLFILMFTDAFAHN